MVQFGEKTGLRRQTLSDALEMTNWEGLCGTEWWTSDHDSKGKARETASCNAMARCNAKF